MLFPATNHSVLYHVAGKMKLANKKLLVYFKYCLKVIKKNIYQWFYIIFGVSKLLRAFYNNLKIHHTKVQKFTTYKGDQLHLGVMFWTISYKQQTFLYYFFCVLSSICNITFSKHLQNTFLFHFRISKNFSMQGLKEAFILVRHYLFIITKHDSVSHRL